MRKQEMNFFTICLIIIMILSYTHADLRYRGNAIHPDYPGQCYYEELSQPISKNQSYRPINRDGHCESIFCRSDYVLEIQYCGRHNLQRNESCWIEQDMNRSYPECCPKLNCQNEDNNI